MGQTRFAEQVERARKELRLVDEPLTPDDVEYQRQQKELKKLDDFCTRLGLETHLVIFPQPVWLYDMAVVQIILSGETFILRPEGEKFLLLHSAPKGSEDRVLTTLFRSDKQISNRLLVALDDALTAR